MKRLLVIVAFLLLWAGCHAPTPVGAPGNVVPHDSAATCTSYCQSIGLPLAAVVIMANNVGCVCNAQAPATPAAPTTTTSAAAAAGGLTALLMRRASSTTAHPVQSSHH